LAREAYKWFIGTIRPGGTFHDLAAVSTFPVNRLWIPLWKIRVIHAAVDLSTDCLIFMHPIVL
jgi:hypothetical protein